MKNRNIFALAVGLLLLLAGNSSYAGLVHWSDAAGDNSWSTSTNWDGGALPTNTDDVLFDNTDGQTGFGVSSSTNNFLLQNFTIKSLTYSNWTMGPTSGSTSDPADPNNLVSQHTDIGSGYTLTVTNGFIVGVSSSEPAKGFPGDPLTYATISGAGGALAVTGGLVKIGYQTSAAATLHLFARLDMSDLGNFSYNVSGGTFGIASAVQRRSGGEVYLARTNFINSLNLWLGIGATGVAGYAGILHLGQSNVMNADSIIIGKDTEGDFGFAGSLSNSMPTVRIRGQNGIGPVGTLYMGWTTSASSSWARGTNDLTFGMVDLSATNLIVALCAGANTDASASTIDNLLIGPAAGNTLVVQNLTVGSSPGTVSTPTKNTQAIGLIDMQGGTFIANSVILGSSQNGGNGFGTLNIHGGIFTAQSMALGTSITPQGVGGGYGYLNLGGGVTTIAGTLTVGGGTAICGVTNATLAVGGQIGASNSYLSSLILSQATLQLALGGGTNIAAYVTNLDIEEPSIIVITNQNLIPGQFPVIAYQNAFGASGVAGLSVSVPAGVAAALVNNSTNLSVDLLVTTVVSPAAQPVLSGGSLTGPASFKLTGTGTANQPYKIYATTNIALPQWILIGTTNADGSGGIQFFDTTTNTQRFYRLSR